MNNTELSCHNCGARIEQYSRFCRNCGVAVNQSTDTGSSGESDLIQKTTRMDRPEIRVPRWRLSKVEGVNIPDGFPLQAQARIGRDPHCDIHLPSTNVSRYHAQVEWTGTGFDITDLNSTNGTYVNRRLIKEPTRLKIGSSVQIGEYTFLVMKDAAQCGSCRETVRSDDRFCQYCGNPLIDTQFHPPVGEHTHEEPFPETTPVPVVPQDTNGQSTPKFNAPLPAELRKAPATVEEKPPPPATVEEKPPPPAILEEKPPPPTAAPPKPAAAAQKKPPPPAPAARRTASAQAPQAPPKPPPPPPAGSPPTGAQAKPKTKGSLLRTCLFLGLAAIGGLVVLGVIGYALFATGVVQRRTFMNISTGEISLTNLTESSMTARLERLDTESGSPENFGTTSLEPYEIGGIAYIEAGRYQLEITGVPTTGACTLQIEARDQFTIVVVNGGIAIAKDGYEPTDPNELDLAMSSLCRQ